MTTGVDIVGTLLRQDTNVIAMVPAESIKAGRLPDDVQLPALLVKATSTVERQALKRGPTTRTIDRVSVTVRAASYREQRLVMRRVRACCAGLTGDIAGGIRVSILTAGTGPELDGPANTFERTQDFKVSYDATS
jgi:hypothetical protein